MSIYDRPWTQVSPQEIALRYAYQTERLAAMCEEETGCGCGCSFDFDWWDLVARFELGEIGQEP